MGVDWRRRRLLRVGGGTLLAALAGCARSAEPEPPLSVTPAPVPDGPDRPDARLSPDDLTFDARPLAPFDDGGPARIAASVGNAGDQAMTAVGASEYVFPFVDDDYAGTDRAGVPRIFLLPDGADLVVQTAGSEGAPIETLLPESTQDGCWSVPFEGRPPVASPDRYLHSVTLPPGEERRHVYRAFYIGDCSAGRYSFQSSFLLAAGDPPGAGGMYRALTGFTLSVTGDSELLVGLESPVLERIDRGPSSTGAAG